METLKRYKHVCNFTTVAARPITKKELEYYKSDPERFLSEIAMFQRDIDKGSPKTGDMVVLPLKGKTSQVLPKEVFEKAFEEIEPISLDPAPAPPKNENAWIPVDKLKLEAFKRVLVVCETGSNRYQLVAEYVPRMLSKVNKRCMPEGFYEWSSESGAYFRITVNVTHWMPLPEMP